MHPQKPEVLKVDISKEISDFAQDAYDYIWCHQEFSSPGVTEKINAVYTMNNSSENESKNPYFTESIGKAVRVTEFLLRDYFKRLFEFAIPEKNTFKQEVKLMWSHWLNNRSSIFVKVIDTLAIVSEAFLFCDTYKTLNLDIYEMKEWFIEWFEENLALEFFKYGGWKQLNELALKWYDDLFENFKELVEIFFSHNSTGMDLFYCCEIVEYLKLSPVEFPVLKRAVCEECILPTNINLHRTVYMRLAEEFQEKISTVEGDCDVKRKFLKVHSEIKNETQL